MSCARRGLATAVALLCLAATPAAGDDDGRAAHDYLLSCGGCHALDASGSARVPSLRGVDRLLARKGGRDYVLRVPGVASAPLSDARLAALLDWVFASFGNHGAPHFTADEVGRARRTPWVDPKAARAALE
jgi:mono/diheme cytochrome c family protein